MNDALRRAAVAVSDAEGDGVFERLTGELADILGVAVGFIAVFADPARSQMRMLAFHLDGRMRAPFNYVLEGTPCALVIGRDFHCLAEGARKEFPASDLFARLGLDSYAAYPLNDARGAPLGLVGAVDSRPLRDVPLCASILKIFAMRVAPEIARHQPTHKVVADGDEVRPQ